MAPGQMVVKVCGYGFQGLTAYEYLHIQEIMKWQRKPSSVVANVSGKTLAPFMRTGAQTPHRTLSARVQR
jgi:hypothetical protein